MSKENKKKKSKTEASSTTQASTISSPKSPQQTYNADISTSQQYKPTKLQGYSTFGQSHSIGDRSITQKSISKDREQIISRHLGFRKQMNDDDIKQEITTNQEDIINYQRSISRKFIINKNSMKSLNDDNYQDRSFSDKDRNWDIENPNNNNNDGFDPLNISNHGANSKFTVVQTDARNLPKTRDGQQGYLKKKPINPDIFDQSNELSQSQSIIAPLPNFYNKSIDSNNIDNNNKRGMKTSHSNPALSKMDKLKIETGLSMTPSSIPRSLSQNFTNYKPNTVLTMLLELPYTGTMGLGSNLKKILEDAVMEQTRVENEKKQKQFQSQKYLTDANKEIIRKNYLPAAPDFAKIPPTYQGNDHGNIDEDDAELLSPPMIKGYKTSIDHDTQTRIKKRIPSVEDFQQILNQGYTFNLIIAVGQGIVAPLLYGYSVSIFNLPQTIIQDQINRHDSQWTYLNTAFCVGGLIGALSGGTLGDWLGRKKAMIIIDALFILAAVLGFGFAAGMFGDVTSTVAYIIFIIARFIVGIASGAGTALAPTYLGEISPALIRGQIGTVNQLMICFGIVLVGALGYKNILGDTNTWKWLVVISGILPAFQLLTLWSFPESPKWLLQKGDESRARAALERLRNTTKVDLDLTMMKAAIDKSKSNNRTSFARGGSSIQDGLLSNGNTHQRKAIFKATLIAVVLMILQQFSGINTVFFYSTDTLNKAGLTSDLQVWIGTNIINISNFLSVFIAVKLMDELGRKKLIYLSGIGMIFASLLMSAVLFIYNHVKESQVWGYGVLVCMVIYVAAFEVGLGPIPWLMTAEIAPGSHRGIIASFATFINWGCNLGIAQFGPQIVSATYYLPFVVVIVLGILFMRFYVPETKGKNEQQIQNELAK